MKTIKQSYLINAQVSKVWQALVNPKIIDEWGGGPAKMSEREGSSFSLWGGDIHGSNLKVIKNKQLVQDWYSGDWENSSKVTFTLKSDGQKTEVDLLHEEVPDDEADEIEDGWQRFYLGPLKDYLEK
ncbi:SRPBCC domain-containing protein [Candidatus Daviesbacteria bacterium]|nr:SRPBCC domain-containing protein [Candidatus Daviesbacteria bacterium]